MEHFVLAVVKAEGVPCGMFTSATAIEILTRIAGKVAQTLHLVLYGMGVDDVHDDGNTHLVGGIN